MQSKQKSIYMQFKIAVRGGAHSATDASGMPARHRPKNDIVSLRNISTGAAMVQLNFDRDWL